MYKQLLIFNLILLNIKNNIFKFNLETHQFLNDTLTTRLNILFFQSWLEIFPSYFARQISPLSSNNQNPTIRYLCGQRPGTWGRSDWRVFCQYIYPEPHLLLTRRPAKIIRNPWCHLNLPKLTLTSHNLKVSHSSPSLESWGKF